MRRPGGIRRVWASHQFRSHLMDHWRGRSTAARVAILGVFASFLTAVAVVPSVTTSAQAATSCPAAGCAVTVDAHDFASGNRARRTSPSSSTSTTRSCRATRSRSNTESNSPIVADRRPGTATRCTLPDGRYLISVRSLDHKMWGTHITLPDDARTTGPHRRIDLTEQSEDHPLPLGKIRVFVFNDNAWTNGAPDTEEAGPAGGFQVGLEEQTGNAVTVDYNNDPLCGGVCTRAGDADGFVADQQPRARRPTSSTCTRPTRPLQRATRTASWYQTTTIDGGLQPHGAGVEEGSDGTGAPGEQLWEPPTVRTAYWFGFVCAPMDFAEPGHRRDHRPGAQLGRVGAVRRPAPIDDAGREPVRRAVRRRDRPDRLRRPGRRRRQLRHPERPGRRPTTWPSGTSSSATSCGSSRSRSPPARPSTPTTPDDDGEVGVGVSRWFGWLDGTVYKDLNANGQFDDGVEPHHREHRHGPAVAGRLDQGGDVHRPRRALRVPDRRGRRARQVDHQRAGLRALRRTRARRCTTSTPARHAVMLVDRTPVDPCVPTQGGGLLTNQLLARGPPRDRRLGQASTTRRDAGPDRRHHLLRDDPQRVRRAVPGARGLRAGDPGRDGATSRRLGPDGVPNTDDDVVVNKYVTDHWQQPEREPDPQTRRPRSPRAATRPRTSTAPTSAPSSTRRSGRTASRCRSPASRPRTARSTAATRSPTTARGGYDLAADDGTCSRRSATRSPLVAGNYIVHVVMPKDATTTAPCNPAECRRLPERQRGHGQRPGRRRRAACTASCARRTSTSTSATSSRRQIPPPPCTGDDHVIDQSTLVTRSLYYGVDPAPHVGRCATSTWSC